MDNKSKKIRIIISLVLSYVAAFYITLFFFVDKTPTLNTSFIASIPEKTGGLLVSLFTGILPPQSPTYSPSPTTEPGFFATPLPTTTAAIPSIPLVISPTAPSVPTDIPVTYSIPAPTTKSPLPTTRPPTSIPTVKAPTQSPTSPPAQLGPMGPCPTSSSNRYSSISILPPATANPQSQADLNLALRGYSQVNEPLTIIDVDGDNDAGKGPQLSTVFGAKRAPRFTATFRVNDWNWASNSRGSQLTNPRVSLVAIAAQNNEAIRLPQSGYSIGGGKQAMVLFATKNSLTLEYTRDDSVAKGYSLHFERICVDPNLLSLYNSLTASGRSSLPAIAGGEIIGTAQGDIMVATRDTGSFLDPRIRKDWWVGY